MCKQISRYNVPFIAFINKLDRTGANYVKVLDQIRTKLKLNAALLQIPIGKESNTVGLIDLISQKALYFKGSCG